MFRLLFLLAAAGALLAACTTYKLWSVADVDPDQATLSMYYEHGKFENPQVDERAGLEMARERCQDWGYPTAQRKGEDRRCVAGDTANCSRWRVIREYRCTGDRR